MIPLFDKSFIYDGLTVTKDGTNVNQVDVATGRVYFENRSGNDLVLFQPKTFTTSTASATYYLNVYPDETMTFSTTNVPKAGYINIATVTTDSNGNVSTITNNSTSTNTNLFPD